MYWSVFAIAIRLPSGPSITSARTCSRDWIPYEFARRIECVVGS